jgi:hypothetical protein
MKINKKLKNVEFEYDEETKTFTIMEADGFNGYIQLNKVYAFAFMRFVVRMAQRNWLRQKKLSPSETKTSLPANNQLEMFEG